MYLEWPTIIHNPYGFEIHMDYGFFMDLKSIWIMAFLWIRNPYGLWIFYGFEIHIDYGFFMDLKFIWIMDFYGFEIHMATLAVLTS